MSATTNSQLDKVAKAYRGISLVVLNTILLFIFINLILLVAYSANDYLESDEDPVSIRYQGIIYDDRSLSAIYPDFSDEKVRTLLRETWSRPYIYDAFTQFKERPFRGEHVNVTEGGFRHTLDQGPWPPTPQS